jgi:transposase
MILKASRYISDRREGRLPHEKLNLRKEVADTLGIAERTVASVTSEFNKTNNLSPAVPTGRPSNGIDIVVMEKIRETIHNANQNGNPISSKIISNLLRDIGIDLSPRTIRRYCRKMGYRYGKGERLNILHETPAVIDYRYQYLNRRFENIDSNNLPRKTEVFLDESYCSIDHHAKMTWVEKKGRVFEKGRAPLIVIFGAIAFFTNGNKFTGEIVPESILMWHADLKKP